MIFAEEIAQAAKHAAAEAGFDLAGIAPIRKEDMPELGAFVEWVDAGRAGEMKYLESRMRGEQRTIMTRCCRGCDRLKRPLNKLPLRKMLNLKRAAMSIRGQFWNAFMPSMPGSDGLARTPASSIRKWAHGFFWA
jgi:hypothetical protein